MKKVMMLLTAVFCSTIVLTSCGSSSEAPQQTEGTEQTSDTEKQSDEKEVKAAQSRLIKRCIYAVAVFFITTLVSLIMNLVAIGADKEEANASSWAKCWNDIKK